MTSGSSVSKTTAHSAPLYGETPKREQSHSKVSFDYEGKVWGGNKVRISPTYLNALRLKYCLADLADVEGTILEIGCGAGGMAKALKAYRPDLDVYGCDISHQAIGVAREHPEGVRFEVADVLNLPTDKGAFDAVVMFDVLEHLESPESAVAAIRKSVVPGGLFHLFVPCEGAPFTLYGVLARLGWRAKEQYGGHIQLLTEGRVRRILEASGFQPIEKRWSGHFLNQLADVAYFTGLSIRGENLSASVEGYLESARPSLASRLLKLSKTGVAVSSFYESAYLDWLPGAGLHISSRRLAN